MSCKLKLVDFKTNIEYQVKKGLLYMLVSCLVQRELVIWTIILLFHFLPLSYYSLLLFSPLYFSLCFLDYCSFPNLLSYSLLFELKSIKNSFYLHKIEVRSEYTLLSPNLKFHLIISDKFIMWLWTIRWLAWGKF